MFKTSLQVLCSSEAVNTSDEVKQAFIQLARSLIQKIIVAPRDKKGVDLTIHGHLATVLATLEAWREEERRLKEGFHQEFVAKREAGAFQTVDDRIRLMERFDGCA
ncbi:hypothetical protein [Nitratireductor sp. CH_MIT9313-5]|jgi:hypothetical protein|uniref:hypothetical protein n=1 Tax=Nitratireductor sp. CH_MIT9313-5 TaxID=3107764 RepID=UPI003009D06E